MPADFPQPDLSNDSRVVDFHLHSNASDGCDPPCRVMERAKRAGLRIVSLTDHDTVAGLTEAQREAEQLGLGFVDGIELSSVHKGRLVHVLGHFIWPENKTLRKQIGRYAESRRSRMDEMLNRLQELGLEVDAEEFYREFGAAVSIGRGQLATYLVRKNLVATRDEVFHRFIGEDSPGYVELKMVSPVEAVEIIRGAGGAATFAHPNLSDVDEIIPDLVDAGLAGIETDHPSQSDDVRQHYRVLAERYGLVEMGGSDCHGERPGPERMGQYNQPLWMFSELLKRV